MENTGLFSSVTTQIYFVCVTAYLNWPKAPLAIFLPTTNLLPTSSCAGAALVWVLARDINFRTANNFFQLFRATFWGSSSAIENNYLKTTTAGKNTWFWNQLKKNTPECGADFEMRLFLFILHTRKSCSPLLVSILYTYKWTWTASPVPIDPKLVSFHTMSNIFYMQDILVGRIN